MKIWPLWPDIGRRTVEVQTVVARRPDMRLMHVHMQRHYRLVLDSRTINPPNPLMAPPGD
jgi:hypothetical protein